MATSLQSNQFFLSQSLTLNERLYKKCNFFFLVRIFLYSTGIDCLKSYWLKEPLEQGVFMIIQARASKSCLCTVTNLSAVVLPDFLLPLSPSGHGIPMCGVYEQDFSFPYFLSRFIWLFTLKRQITIICLTRNVLLIYLSLYLAQF